MPRPQRRAQLVQAAGSAFLRAGYDGTSMDDVAREAGVTRLIVYRIFETKQDLYRSVLDATIDSLSSEFIGDSGIFARGEIAPRLLRIARTQSDGFRLLWRHATHEAEFADYAAAFIQAVVEIADDLFRDVVADPTMRAWAARSMVGFLYDGICRWLDDGDEARDDEFATMLTRGAQGLVMSLFDPPS
jgi:AcrR family transcriptional regulator